MSRQRFPASSVSRSSAAATAVTSLSYHDTARPAGELVFHAFIVGLFVWLQGEYHVRSNRESGYGRADVLVVPREAGRPGVALELKSVDTPRDETPESAPESALRQLRERDYAAEVRAAGADPVHEVAAVFDGKRVWVDLAEREVLRALDSGA